MKKSFYDQDLALWLNEATPFELDSLPFGVVKMNHQAEVVYYSETQSLLTGVSPAQAKGKNFFVQVAPCTNNFMVAEKFNQLILDETMPYMFTYVTKPTPVTLRLIKTNNWQFLLTQKA
ncbi:MAG: PAS domain-containing protein [Chitinophagaceae bacterium]